MKPWIGPAPQRHRLLRTGWNEGNLPHLALGSSAAFATPQALAGGISPTNPPRSLLLGRGLSFSSPTGCRTGLAGGLAEAGRISVGVEQLLHGILQTLSQHIQVSDGVPVSGETDEHVAVVRRQSDGQ
jgi:hypothetical protein